MSVNIVVCVKQVIDPDTPSSAFQIDHEVGRGVVSSGVPPVINGFDENAVEAALRVKDAVGGTITVLSLGSEFVMEVVKKPLSMGADRLVLLQDDSFSNLDSFGTAYALSKAIKKIGSYDLILCGRQASDWDNAQVPLGLAEILGLPCITVAQKVEIVDGFVTSHRALPDGYEVVEASLPALVTVTNELGEPRYATLRGIMAAGRKNPDIWGVDDLGIDRVELQPKILVTKLSIPSKEQNCEFIQGENEADSGRQLAIKLIEANLI